MSSKPVNKNDISLILKRALYTIKLLKEQAHSYASEPIAIVGMACRFPGGSNTPDKFWEFLKNGEDGITEVPAERFNVNEYYDPNPNSLDKMYLREAGFLREDIKDFDARFFGISPREVQDMDPQQRILLELSWEALERAGMAPNSVKNSRTGVFIGLTSSEYGMLPRNKEAIGPYTMLGSLANIASGRISHFFGFHGPAITLDTACSSSLVSTHLACESLQRGECDMALAGGVSLMLSPIAFILLCKVQALAKDGRSKAFDASADGYGRGEGGGIVVLKRLADAEKDNDPILAVIKGSAVNQDGPSSGLTVPNGAAQQELLKDTLKKAGLNPEDIGYFEAHGTGTPLGDPIEVQAINEVYGQKGRSSPLYLGTVKANIGHLEAAAGIAAVIKSVLCLQHKMIPSHLYTKTLNPRINLEKIPAILAKKLEPWDSADKLRAVAMSSFGFSGTNAHVIMSEYVARGKQKSSNTLENELQILTLSAYDNTALKALAKEYLDYSTDHPEAKIADICYTANTGRASFSNRVAFLAKNKDQLHEHINDFLHDQAKGDFVFQNQIILGSTPKIAFLFGGEEVVSFEKYASLYKNYPVFRDAIDACSKLFEPYLGYSLLNDFSQTTRRESIPHLFSIEYALSQLWASWGIKPSAVLGEKTGTYVAACVAGVMSLETAIQSIARNKDQQFELKTEDLLPPQISIVSSSTGKFMKKSEVMIPGYWQGQLSGTTPFEFDKGMQSLYEQGYTIFVEIGVGNNLLNKAKKCLTGKEAQYISSLNGENSSETLARGIAQLYSLGANINWYGFYNNADYTKLVLPTYPFQRKTYWLAPYKDEAHVSHLDKNKDPLVGRQIFSPLSQKQFEFVISIENLPMLKDTHNLMHVGYFQEMIRNVIKTGFNDSPYTLLNMEFIVGLTITEGEIKTISLILNPQDDDELEMQFYSRSNEKIPWMLHVKGRIKLEKKLDLLPLPVKKIDELKQKYKKKYVSESFYKNLQDRGIDLGISVRLVDEVWASDYEVLARFKHLNESRLTSLWDACAQLFHVAIPDEVGANKSFMVNQWNNFCVDYKSDISELWCYVDAEIYDQNSQLFRGAFYLFNKAGKVVAQCENCEMKAVDLKRMEALQQAMVQNKALGKVKNVELFNKLHSVPKDNQTELLRDYLHDTIAVLLNMSTKDLSIDESLGYLGMDSLVGLEFVNKVYVDLGITVPMEIMVQGPSIKALATELIPLLPKQATEEKAIENSEKKDVTPEHYPAGYSLDRSVWLNKTKTSKSPIVRLFCLPYGGGGANLYKKWQEKMPSSIEVIPIQLPGRESRRYEKLIENINEMVEVLESVIAPELDLPYAIYGHSMGALIAFCLALSLSKNIKFRQNLRHLFVAAYTSPQQYPNPIYIKSLNKLKSAGFKGIPNLHDLEVCSDEKIELLMDASTEMRAMVEKYKNSSETDRKFFRLLLATLFADVKLVESYVYNEKDILDLPITAFHGDKDDQVSCSEMEAWKELTSDSFKIYTLPGDHFFLHEDQSQDKLISIIRDELLKG